MNWEIQLLQMLQAHRTPGLTAFMEAISFMAESTFVVAIIATLYWCINKEMTKRMAWLLLLSGVTNGIVKNLVRAPRPFQKGVVSPLRIETATSYAFPSGHVQSATSFWGVLTLFFRSTPIIVISVVMIVLTGLSRMYLGVHWPMDVIGGIILGLLTIGVGNLLYDEQQGFTKYHVLGVGVMALILALLPVDTDLASAVGALWGVVIGGFIEAKFIQFQVSGNWKVQLKKLIIGFGGTLILHSVWQSVFPRIPACEMVQYALLLVWITAGAPYVFKRYIIPPQK